MSEERVEGDGAGLPRRARVWWAALPDPSRRRILALLAAALAVFIHLGAVGHEFVFDDNAIIQNNPLVHDLDRLPEVLTTPYWPGTYGPDAGLWRPVTSGLYNLQWALWDGNPVGFNTVLIVLHGIATFLVTLLALELAPAAVALLAGLVFAVHPVHVEVTANVVGTAEVLSALLVVAAALVHVRGGSRYGIGRALAVALLYGLAFLSKEASVTFLGLVFLLDAFRTDLSVRDLRDYVRRRWVTYALLLAVAVLVLWGRSAVLGTVASAIYPTGAHILTEVPRIWTVLTTWPFYVQLLIFPLELSADYGPRVIPIKYGPSFQGWVGAGVILLFLALSWALWRRAREARDPLPFRALGFGVLWVVITMSPVSNLLFLTGILLAERVFYLPSVGFSIAAGWILWIVFQERRRVGMALIAVWIGFLSVRTVTRVPVWRTHFDLFIDLTEHFPQSGRAHWFLGSIYAGQGNREKALQAWSRAIPLLNGDFVVVSTIADAMARAGEGDLARVLLNQLARDWSDYRYAIEWAALGFFTLGDTDDQIRLSRQALEGGSTNLIMYHVLASGLSSKGELEEAVEVRRRGIGTQFGSDWSQWLALAGDLHRMGRIDEAVAALDSAREVRVDDSYLPVLDSMRAEWLASDTLSDFARDLQIPSPNQE